MKLRFDRGTILLTGPPERPDLAGAPGVVWDARVGAHRTPAIRYPALKRWLVEGKIPFQDIAPPLRPAGADWSSVVDLRPYQEAALAAWELGHRRGVIALPTGSGKTRLALAALQRTCLSALCLVPTRVLVDQWLREIGTVHRGPVGCYGDGVRQLHPLTVATFESAYRHMAHLGDRFDLLIVDEVHHFGGGLRDEALEMAIAGTRLGLTATPPRGAAATRLDELVGPTLFELTVADLAGGFLASFDVITLHLDLSPEERTTYSGLRGVFQSVHGEFRRTAPGATWLDFTVHAARTPEGRRALAAWRQMGRLVTFTHAKRRALAALLERHRLSRVLIFTADNETAYAIARLHLVMPLTCDIGRRERAAVLEQFRLGHLRTLVSARVLNEGLDVPDADVAVIVGGTLGEREHVQRVGRLLRPSEGKRAMVYELVTRHTIEVGQARRRRQGLAARAPAQL